MTFPAPTRAALYARISQTDADIPAIANQTATLRRMALREGYTVVREYADDGKSGYSGKLRPAFVQMVAGVEAGLFDVVLAVADDRLHRNDEEAYLLRSKCTAHGVRWHTAANGITDPSTAQGGLMAKLNAGIAEYESALKAERIRRSVGDRLAQGLDLGGRRAFGFDGRRTPTINEAEAAVIRAGVAMILDGASVYAVAEAWNKTGVMPPGGAVRWRTQTVRSILLRPRNIGHLVVKGVDHGAKLPAIVTEENHAAVAAILNDPKRRPRRGKVPRTSTALGVVRCGVCGGRLETTGSGPKGELGVRCADRAPGDTRRHPIMSVDALELQLSEAVLARVLYLAARGDSFTGGRAEVTGMRLQLAEVQRQRDRQQNIGAMPGANLAIVAAALADFGRQIDELNSKIDTALAADASARAMAIAHDFVTSLPGHITIRGGEAREPWAALWASTPIEQRRNLVRALLVSVELLPASRTAAWRLGLGSEAEGFPWEFLESLGWLPRTVIVQNT